jgi:hypothetical protein
MNITIYPQVIDKVLNSCAMYTNQEINSKTLQQVIYWAEHSIVNFEEKELRNFLMEIEGDIDTVRALANGTNIDSSEEVEDRKEILKIITKLRENLLPLKIEKPKEEDAYAWPFPDDS